METKVKLTDLSQVETLIQSTQAFTEQLVLMNKLLEHIGKNTSKQAEFFISKDGFVKSMQDIMTQHHFTVVKDIRYSINIMYLKLAASMAGLVGVAIAILEVISK